jgi:hypothetical protein
MIEMISQLVQRLFKAPTHSDSEKSVESQTEKTRATDTVNIWKLVLEGDQDKVKDLYSKEGDKILLERGSVGELPVNLL